ncbi:hypothetical protein ASQ49_02690 [Acidipropionibacterium acidipropionici]|nr:hypothetical protein ASQ49_02690 [Acidipropionibacterium acidipropionici]APZ09882.1 hypothetical protein BWX38_12260 [Acidipropionibacterium acidipropionici]
MTMRSSMTADTPDPMSQVLNAGLDLARAELEGRHLDPDEMRVLELCDDIGDVRGIAEHEMRQSNLQVITTVSRDMQAEEDIKAWEEEQSQRCSSSGQDVGRMINIDGMDDWRVECPTCGAMWWGGSTVLPEHDKPRG